MIEQAPIGPLIIPKVVKQPLLLSIIIPTLNEKENIVFLVKELVKLLDKVKDYEIIVVDDDSEDLTWQVAYDLAKKVKQLRVVRRVNEKGLATAVIRGFQVARGDLLAVINSDLEHPVKPVIKMIAEIEKDVDLVVGCCENKKSSFFSLAKLLGLVLLPKVFKKTTDPMSGYFMVKRKAIADVELYPVGYKTMLEVIARGDVKKVKEIGVTFSHQKNGHNKLLRKKDLEYLQHLFRLQISSWPLVRFGRWFLVGTSGFVVDMLLFSILFSLIGFSLTISTLISAEIALINNFIWNDRWTFGDISKSIPSLYQKGMRFWKFNLICLSGLLFHVLLLRWFVNTVEINPYIAKIMTILIVAMWNIILNFRFNWRVKSDLK